MHATLRSWNGLNFKVQFKDYQYYAVSKRERTLPDMVFFRYNLFKFL